MGSTRRDVLMAGFAGSAAFASALLWPRKALARDETLDLVERLTGKAATEFDRLRLVMPAVFPTGYTVPMSLDGRQSDDGADHVRQSASSRRKIRSSRSSASTSRRSAASRVCRRASALPKPQYVVAVAEMNDGALLMTKTWVDVATDGCA